MRKNNKIRHVPGRRIAITAVAVIMAAGSLSAASFAAKPDFSGTWTLNEEKSEIGERRFMSSAILDVTQDKTNLTVVRTRTGRDGQERKMESVYRLDGKETTSEGERRTTVSTVNWSEDGKSLLIRSKSSFSREGETFEFEMAETWMLGDSGETLTIKTTSSSSRGEFSQMLVYDLVK